MNELKLTNTERMIMEVIWQDGELSNTEIFEKIGEAHDWSRHMVKFYTKTMAEKGLLGVNQISERKIRYYPKITKEQYLASAANGFLRRNYRGLSNMVAGLIDNEKVSREEIDELEQLIRDFKETNDGSVD
jgi:BlaI family transcriptional regulator, penicillinase repressor